MAEIDMITPDPVYGASVQFDENGDRIKPVLEDFSLTDEEKICFHCPMSDCVEEGKLGCVVELRAMEVRIDSYRKQKEKGTISAAGTKKLSTLTKQTQEGWHLYNEAVAKKLGATYIGD